MATKIPYKADRDSLYHPCKNAEFFLDGRPETEAWLCAEMSRLVYCSFEDSEDRRRFVEESLERIGFDGFDPFSEEGTQGFLARDDAQKTALLVFRGTEKKEFMDILTDLDARQVAWDGGGRVHKGFREALERVQQQVEALLETVDGYRLLFTGHSLGAALATLAAELWPPATLYTFGSPRVGDAAFKNSVEKQSGKVGRHVDCSDIVTMVPPRKLTLGTTLRYEHVGELVYIDRHGRILQDPGRFRIFYDRLRAWIDYDKHAFVRGNVALRPFADHSPINYLSAFPGREKANPA